MKFWKEHTVLRMVLMLVTFVLGMLLVVYGGGMLDGFLKSFTDALGNTLPQMLALCTAGELSGLFVMLVGIALLLTTLSLYNKPFEEPKTKKMKSK